MAKKALILTDGKAGHENQSKAFARFLGCDVDLLPIAFKSKKAKALSYFCDFFNIHKLDLFSDKQNLLDSLQAANYSVVLGTGSGTFYGAKVIAKLLGIKCAVVLYPRGYKISTFNCVLAPCFDKPASKPNVVEIPANLVANDADFYSKGLQAFHERYLPSDKSAVAVIIGGPNKSSSMTAEWIKDRLDDIFAKTSSCEHWVTTSRRTPKDVEAVVESYPWDYKLIYSKDQFNPIPAFVASASELYVTAESTGMLSEACTCGGAKVFALDNLNPGGHKFRRFVNMLRDGGYIDGARKVDLTSQIARARELLGL